MTSPLPSGVFWDMDGTIVDTEPYWMAAEEQLVTEFGIPWTHEDSLEIVGAALLDAARVFQRHGVDLPAEEIVSRLNDSVIKQIRIAVPWRPGARELLLQLRERSVPTALVTMSYGEMAHLVAESIGFPAFDAVITGDLVSRGKPHPEPYLHAARTLGLDPTECVAIEDSPTGVASAVASGMATIAVPAHVHLAESDDYTLWTTLDGRSVDDLSAVLAATRTKETLR
ncbi:HAD family phosphatase [Salinibacterium sp. dk2585]|uniref:HAD family hydrolase n=1 Tax=unclassified Salinibacterium TaxID=2632331 RepID=UPI0011C2445A|nr:MULTISPECIES: HAD family phosphatase [unclassified Salinibacterium]QEE61159.1 HAD family phosphatase [Salinibacterium sp. dk2585]TXK53102.1 HAD family phosphatase [Salinibacterium sp. dk5596]